MIHIFRQHQRYVMLAVAIIIIVTFVVFYDPANLHKIGTNSVAEMYGQSLSQADIDRQVKSFNLARSLSQYELIGELGGMGQSEEEVLNEFVWNLMVLQHQAKELGIEPLDSQIKDGIMALPVFQTNGQFDPRKYAEFVQERLGPNGLTEAYIENVIRDSLRLERLKSIVGAPVAVTPGEVTEAVRTLQKMDLQKVKFPLPDPSTVTVADADINVFFERNKATMIKPETRVVSYVEFVPAPADAALTGKAKIDALQKLADQATAFSEQATGATFDQTAAKAGLTVKTSPEFNGTGDTEAPGDLTADLKTIAPSAFQLTEATSVSDVLQSGDKFFVVKLTKTNPQRPLTIEEVRPLIEARLRGAKAGEMLSAKAAAAVATIRAELAAGKPFADAAAAAGVTTEPLNGFSVNSESLSIDQRELATVALVLEPGQISNFIPSADGGFAVFLASRTPAEADTAQKEEIEEGILQNKQRMIFLTWLAAARDQAKIVIAPRGQQ